MHARRNFLALTLLLCAFSVLLSARLTHAAASPRVLAFYYAWFDANSWNPSLLSDLPAPTYNSSDPATVARHISQAKSSGIDAFVVSWIGTNNPTDSNFKTMLGQAAGANFKATIDFEVQHFGTRDQVISALSYVRDAYMGNPAFLRDGSRPVLFFWREQNFSLNDWAAIRAAVDPNHNQVWIAEGTDISYQQVFDGHHLYSIAWSSNPAATLADWGGRVRRAGADKIWVATVMPGYDDTGTTRSDSFSRDRANGDYYRSTWQGAINSAPDWVIITSFNEWVEGSQIEPSVSYGNLYLDLTRQYAAQYKAGAPSIAPAAAPAAAPATRAPIRIPTRAATPTPLAPNQRLATDILRVRSGPGQDYEILGRLRQNRAVEVIARTPDGEWLAIPYPDPAHTGWVSAEFLSPGASLLHLPVWSDEDYEESWDSCPFLPMPSDDPIGC